MTEKDNFGGSGYGSDTGGDREDIKEINLNVSGCAHRPWMLGPVCAMADLERLDTRSISVGEFIDEAVRLFLIIATIMIGKDRQLWAKVLNHFNESKKEWRSFDAFAKIVGVQVDDLDKFRSQRNQCTEETLIGLPGQEDSIRQVFVSDTYIMLRNADKVREQLAKESADNPPEL